jgi:hypothetical protein
MSPAPISPPAKFQIRPETGPGPAGTAARGRDRGLTVTVTFTGKFAARCRRGPADRAGLSCQLATGAAKRGDSHGDSDSENWGHYIHI